MVETSLDDIISIESAMKNLEVPFLVGGYTRRNIDTTDPLTYIGLSTPGTLDSSSDWLIVRVTVNGQIIKFRYAPNTSWDDRATATYL